MIVESLNEQEWTRTLESLRAYSFFATPRFVNAWIRHFAPRARPCVVRIGDSDRSRWIAAFVEFRASRLGTRTLIGTPEGGYGIVGDRSVPRNALERLCSLLGTFRTESIELTIGPDMNFDPTSGGVYLASGEDAWVIDLKSGLDVWWEAGLDKRVRRQIRKSETDGVYTRACGVEGLDAFYALYEHSLQADPKRNLKYPKAFLKDLICADGPGHASLYLTYHEQRCIAGGFLVRGGTEALAWVGAMDRDYASLNGNANRHTAVMRDLFALGATSYNLGAAPGLSDIAAFKRKLGAQPKRYYTLRWHNRIWSRIREWQAGSR